ncbi:tRNA (N(6)-L-threonylcarbamoyladenosine(37)-C(2))-methylthiotransferase MtaB, partial [Verrucomicrobiota bacterium]
QYRELVEYAQQQVGSIGLGTDALVGFPGEDSRAFAATEELIRELPFSNLHVFAYSRRQGTRACEMNGQVPGAVKKDRVARLIELGQQKRENFAKSWIGREVSVLVETVETTGEGTGWTGEYLKARVKGRNIHTNQIVRFVPERVEGDVLVGEARP